MTKSDSQLMIRKILFDSGRLKECIMLFKIFKISCSVLWLAGPNYLQVDIIPWLYHAEAKDTQFITKPSCGMWMFIHFFLIQYRIVVILNAAVPY